MSEAADPLGALRSYLLTDAGLSDAVDGRVRCLALHADDTKNADGPGIAAIVLKPAGGPGARGYQQFGKKRIDVTCYGTNLDESWDIYLTVKPLLHHLRRVVSQGVLLHSAREESAGASGIDPFSQWPTTYSSWILQAADVPAA